MEYLDFLKLKFGDIILNEMIPNHPKELRLFYDEECENIYKNELVNNKSIENVISSYPDEIKSKLLNIKHNDTEKIKWAFDFPGWVGNLDFTHQNVKEIMVIGMEPHIEDRFYQTTYGLRETSKEVFKEVSQGNNKNIWKNLNIIFGDKDEYLNSCFLSKIYITDLSHLSLEGKAKKILSVKEWKNIRKEIAIEFLTKEIQLIKPNFIVSQGNEVARILNREIFKDWKIIQQISAFHRKPVSWKTTPVFTKFLNNLENQSIVHLQFPHLASGFTQALWKSVNDDFKLEIRRQLSHIS